MSLMSLDKRSLEDTVPILWEGFKGYATNNTNVSGSGKMVLSITCAIREVGLREIFCMSAPQMRFYDQILFFWGFFPEPICSSVSECRMISFYALIIDYEKPQFCDELYLLSHSVVFKCKKKTEYINRQKDFPFHVLACGFLLFVSKDLLSFSPYIYIYIHKMCCCRLCDYCTSIWCCKASHPFASDIY